MAAVENKSPESIPDEKLIRAEFKKKSFDRELRAFVKQAQETIEACYGISMEFGNVRSELVHMNKYMNVYDNMDPHEHYRYFETLFNRKRNDVLNCLKDDRWIRTGNIIIQYGEGIKMAKDLEEKRKFVRIPVSDIFLIAYDIQRKAEIALEGIDEKFAQDAGGKDLIRPAILLLHLMRIFYYLTDGSDKESLGAIVTQLEIDLGVGKRTVAEDPVKAAKAAAIPAGASPMGSNTGLSGLFVMATNMMEKMGYKPPEGMKPPSEGEINNVISQVFNNETTQNAIQGMFSSMQGCTDFGSAIQHVVKNVTDPKIMADIQSSVAQTAINSPAFNNHNPVPINPILSPNPNPIPTNPISSPTPNTASTDAVVINIAPTQL